MKRKIMLINVLLLTLFTTKDLFAQCSNKVSHASGTKTINGIEVTTTSFGFVDSIEVCDYSEPFIIGWELDELPHGDGGFTFQFSPPIDSLDINFSYINAGDGTEEVVKIYLNGAHYFITEIGESLTCSDSMAIITPTGDMGGQSTEHHYGGNVHINGPIYELTVMDSFLIGQPLGVAFSLFICSEFITSVDKNTLSDIEIYPIPSNHTITIEEISSLTKLRLLDLFGRPVYIDPIIQDRIAMIKIDHLPNGIYYLNISINDDVITRKVIVSND